jgi:anion transporter
MITPKTCLKNRLSLNPKYIFFWAFVIAGLLVGFLKPWAPDLSALGHKVLMGLIIVIGLWVFKPWGIPLSVSGCLLMMLCLFYGIDATAVFAGFTSSAIWVLIPALFFGFVLVKTGLGKRISLLVIKSLRPSYPALMLAWVVIGLVLSTATPSISVRVAIITPLALSCVEVCKLERGSNGRALILLTAWAMAVIPGSGWLTGTLWGPIMLGLFDATPGLEGVVTFGTWSKVNLMPFAIISVLLIIGGYFVFRPEKEIAVSKEIFEDEYAKMGPMSKNEKAAGIVLFLCFALFATSQIHQIPDPAICLGCLFALTAAGVIKTQDLSGGISWDLVIFIGSAMGLGTIFVDTGVSKWLASVLVPAMAPISRNCWIFVFGIFFVILLWRFFDIATLIPTMAILVPILPQLATAYGISPIVWTAIFLMTGNCFFMSYTNMFALVGESILGDKGWRPKQMSRYGLVYFAVCIITLLIIIPYWNSLGLFG